MDTVEPSASTWATAGSGDPNVAGGRRDIIVIGAAMGGLSAVCKLLGSLPASLDAAMLLALDIGSQPAEIVLQILQTYSPFRVAYASHGGLIRRGRVLVAPPGHDMRIQQPGFVGVENSKTYSRGHPSVNGLFKTAATAYGHRVIGIVLSGGSDDGTAGLSFIEAAGGIGIVQDPEEAANPSMPESALRGDDPDYCSELTGMARLAVQLAAGLKPSAPSQGY